ncbi:MAG: bifunctional folylpolyglutamate synthase/dihydrofolate synthase [Chloroflexi bacterium]|nr:bifunctional folylpolyglutamate synthase/dihydrofolate synthase [Chloroflexota bacterium]
MNYPSAVDYILSFADYERIPRSAVVFDLRRIEMLLARLGNPQNAAKTVHIAGTKGKGSTAAMIASILYQSGYRTGLYTSPHLLSIRERLQVDGEPITEKAFARLVSRLKPEFEAVNESGTYGELTTFELLTALALAHFKESAVDYQVLEAGLGGRLDATNVTDPEICVITSISYDHMDVLGDTLAEIAAEKAGIIKPKSVVVVARQSPEARAVIEKTCREKGARLVSVGSEITWQRQTAGPDGQTFRLKGISGEYDLSLPLAGEHQLENAAAAVAAVEVLKEHGARISPESIARGLAQVHWPGRLQVMRREPWLVVDGAHNADSARRLVAALRQYFVFQRLTLIFGASSDKNIAGMVAELASFPNRVIVTSSRHPRAVSPDSLSGEFTRQGMSAEVTENVSAAIEIALAGAAPGDLICVTGSLFIVAEAMEYFVE